MNLASFQEGRTQSLCTFEPTLNQNPDTHANIVTPAKLKPSKKKRKKKQTPLARDDVKLSSATG